MTLSIIALSALRRLVYRQSRQLTSCRDDKATLQRQYSRQVAISHRTYVGVSNSPSSPTKPERSFSTGNVSTPGSGIESKAIDSVAPKVEFIEAVESKDVSPRSKQLPNSKQLDGLRGIWDNVPGRWKVIYAIFAAFVVCNMDKVNMSVAIIPMAREFGWGPSVAGFIQAGFFVGYLFSQLPGGFLSARLGGRVVLPGGVTTWSLATAAIPPLAFSVPTLVLSRAAVGVGEAIAPSAATDMVAKILPNKERSGAVALIFGGLNLGTILGLLLGPYMIQHLGWPWVFYGFGGLGLLWTVAWEALQRDLRSSCPEAYYQLNPWEPQSSAEPSNGAGPHVANGAVATNGAGVRSGSNTGNGAVSSSSGQKKGGSKVTLRSLPVRGFLRSRPLWATLSAHVANNYLLYNVLAWLPSYFVQTQGRDLISASQLALAPPLVGFLTSILVGKVTDALIERGVPLTSVRKRMQAASFGGAGGLLLILTTVTGHDSVASTILITAALAMSNFSYGGLYCSHQDMSPKYAPIMLSWTNTWASLPGIFGISLTGVMLEQTGSWNLALFYPTTIAMLLSLAVYLRWGDSRPQDFDADHDKEFGWEATAREVLPRWVVRWVYRESEDGSCTQKAN